MVTQVKNVRLNVDEKINTGNIYDLSYSYELIDFLQSEKSSIELS